MTWTTLLYAVALIADHTKRGGSPATPAMVPTRYWEGTVLFLANSRHFVLSVTALTADILIERRQGDFYFNVISWLDPVNGVVDGINP